MSTSVTHLVVARSFPGYSRGDLVTDPSTVTSLLEGPYRGHVNRVVGAPTAAELAVDDAQAKLEAAEAALHTAEAHAS